MGIIIFAGVILKKTKILIHNYLSCCEIPNGYSSNSFNIGEYVNILEITSTLHYVRLA